MELGGRRQDVRDRAISAPGQVLLPELKLPGIPSVLSGSLPGPYCRARRWLERVCPSFWRKEDALCASSLMISVSRLWLLCACCTDRWLK